MSTALSWLMVACRAKSSPTSMREAVSLSMRALTAFMLPALRSATVRSVSMMAPWPSEVTPAAISPLVSVTSVGVTLPSAATSSR